MSSVATDTSSLERIPMELLILLIEKQGAVVSRQEIVERLWGKDVFVDTEHGINTAIRKIRATLRDDAEKPRFVQTVLGKGYRFVGEPAPVDLAQSIAPAPQSDLRKAIAPLRRRRSTAIIGTAALTLIALLLLGWNFKFRDRSVDASQQPIRSIAVLPLVNLSGDHSQDYFADGMTDELITMLAKNTSLRVVSRTSVMRYKGVSRPLHEIAHELGTDGVLEGSISRSTNRLHLTVQLVQGQTDAHIWAESYDRDPQDAVAMLSDLSQTIAKQVNVATSPQQQVQKKVNPEAYNLYLRARVLWFNGNYARTQDLYEKVIQLEPNYALAWSGLSDSYTGLALNTPSELPELREKAEAAARKALELDPSLAEAHHSMAAAYYFLEWNWKAAEIESQRSTQLNANLSESHHLRSYILSTLNRREESLEEQKLASSLDPDLRPNALGRAYLHFHRFDDAVQELRARVRENPHGFALRSMLEDAYHFAGMDKEAADQVAEIYRLNGDLAGAAAVQREFQRGGYHAVAVWNLNRWKSSIHDPYELAIMYARAGQREPALRAIETAYKIHAGSMPWLQLEPDFDFLHSESRYRAIVKKMNLAPTY